MFNFFDKNKRTLTRYQKTVNKINELEKEYEELSDQHLKAKTEDFRKRLQAGETTEDILAEALRQLGKLQKEYLK